MVFGVGVIFPQTLTARGPSMLADEPASCRLQLLAVVVVVVGVVVVASE